MNGGQPSNSYSSSSPSSMKNRPSSPILSARSSQSSSSNSSDTGTRRLCHWLPSLNSITTSLFLLLTFTSSPYTTSASMSPTSSFHHLSMPSTISLRIENSQLTSCRSTSSISSSSVEFPFLEVRKSAIPPLRQTANKCDRTKYVSKDPLLRE